MRIAVIDDEKYSRVELIHQILSHIPDAVISEASNGVQAIALIERKSFDILFIDIHLGDLEGTTVASGISTKIFPNYFWKGSLRFQFRWCRSASSSISALPASCCARWGAEGGWWTRVRHR